jgi:hypothetical protein
LAVRQNRQFTAHPTWLDTQIVARLLLSEVRAAGEDESLP